ncbi:hypothetical protein ACC760_39145, partial [Rhizobium ruizarguesonis]
ERRSAFGKERYSALGIAREDLEARQRAAIANWNCFGAPASLFCYIDRDLRPSHLRATVQTFGAEQQHDGLKIHAKVGPLGW